MDRKRTDSRGLSQAGWADAGTEEDRGGTGTAFGGHTLGLSGEVDGATTFAVAAESVKGIWGGGKGPKTHSFTLTRVENTQGRWPGRWGKSDGQRCGVFITEAAIEAT